VCIADLDAPLPSSSSSLSPLGSALAKVAAIPNLSAYSSFALTNLNNIPDDAKHLVVSSSNTAASARQYVIDQVDSAR